VRSVNGKGLDVRLRLPNGLDTVEQQVRALAAKHLKRGNVQMSLQLDCEEQGSELRINQAALAAAIAAAHGRCPMRWARRCRQTLYWPCAALWKPFLQMLMRTQLRRAMPSWSKAADIALAALAANRAEEGKRLAGIIAGQLDTIEELTAQAKANPSRTPGRHPGTPRRTDRAVDRCFPGT
jgi:uncharacterized protein (TIGR00255 family)